MARTISLGTQRFENIRANGYFYVDKTGFVSDWWRTGDDVTLICRPRRFGKTLNLDTVRCFLSRDFAGRGDELFCGLSVWDDPAMRELQGTVPVVSVSFADVKKSTLDEALREIRQILRVGVEAHSYLLASPSVSEGDRAFLARVTDDMDDVTASTCLKRLCAALLAHYGVRPVVLLDEYDAPMQQAWTGGFWDGMSDFMRGLMNSTFKTNPALGRGLITGVTRVSRESIFSDLNNLSIVTTSTPLYQTCFGFTEEEVMTSLREFGLEDKAEDVRAWYDGFVFDGVPHIYNPWSVTQFLRYDVSSNRESGFGRCDVMLIPNDGTCGCDPAIILEFKVFDAHRERALEDTVARARQQIEERGYRSALEERGITSDRIHVYGIAFRGKDVLIG